MGLLKFCFLVPSFLGLPYLVRKGFIGSKTIKAAPGPEAPMKIQFHIYFLLFLRLLQTKGHHTSLS